MSFVHLHLHSPFSFLDGVSEIGTLVERCAELEMPAIALTDHNTVAGVVRLQKECDRLGIQPIFGAEITLENDSHLTLLARNEHGYENLCRLLSQAHLEHERDEPHVSWNSLIAHQDDLICLSGCRRGAVSQACVGDNAEEARLALRLLTEVFGKDRCYVELQRTGLPGDRIIDNRLAQLAEDMAIPIVATNNVHYARKEDFPTHDVVSCIRLQCQLDEPHPERSINAERYLRSPQDMERTFADRPEALRNTLRIAEMCEPVRLGGANFMPHYPFFSEVDPARLLTSKTFAGAVRKYGRLTPKLWARIEEELEIIIRLGFAEYFLVVEDVVRFAQQKGIRYSGRGSAADSVVAYCLGLTLVDAFARNLRFERFLNPERANSLPDVDLDFDARHRDVVTRYVTETHGEDHVATVATFQTYHARGAVRDVARVLGIDQAKIGPLAKRIPMFAHARDFDGLMRKVPELRAANIPKWKYELLFRFATRLDALPRHIGTHCGGVVVSGKPIYGLGHVQRSAKGVNIIPFDKVDIEDLGLVKLDLLCLRILGAVQDTERHLERRALLDDTEPLRFEDIPLDDKETFALLNSGETAGVFQLESPAQRALQQRLMSDNIEDVVASVALIRPGPIQGEMVEPFIRRRIGLEEVQYLLPELRPILEKTYGVVLFQEQVIEIAIAVAGFTPGEADILRRTITRRRLQRDMEALGELFTQKAMERGVSQDVAETVFSYVRGYAGYGFCEAHAAAFGDTAYKTAYLLQHHPAPFFTSLLNNQPMGYYPYHVLITEVKRRGISILPLDINLSSEDFRAHGDSIRVGWRAVQNLRTETKKRMLDEEHQGAFESIPDFIERVRPHRDELEVLTLAGAFDSFHTNRRAILWAIARGTLIPEGGEGRLNLSASSFPNVEDMSEFERCIYEWKALGFSARRHPIDFVRTQLEEQGAVSCDEAKALRKDRRIRVGGLVIRPHRPPTKSGKTVVFVTMGDETGLLDVTVFEDTYQRYGGVIYTEAAVLVEGTMTFARGASLIADRIYSLRTQAPEAETLEAHAGPDPIISRSKPSR